MTDFKMALPVLLAFAISVILGPIVIPYLRKLKMGQTERVEGVQSHLKKAGTPTMGGIIFLLSTTVTSLFYVKDYPKIIPVLFLTLGFGVIGYLFQRYGFPLPPILLALILGPMAESNLRRELVISQGSPAIFLQQPIALFLMGLAVISLLMAYVSQRKVAKRVAAAAGGDETNTIDKK